MATTTTNYAFDVPTSSDLVKNGATAIAELGQDIDTFLFRPFTKNGVINSAFDIWQRGTSIATGGSFTYGADRWQTYRGGLASGSTVSRQATGDTTNLPFIQYCARVQRDSGNTSTAGIVFYQSFESVNSIPYAGKQVTLSFYARKGANYSAASSNLSVDLITGTGTDQNYGSAGYTGAATAATGTVVLTTTWQRFSVTGTVAATATELTPAFTFTPVGTAGAADYYEITGVQLEVGNKATPFTRVGGTIQGELAACQRYYWRTAGGTAYNSFGVGQGKSSTVVGLVIPFPVTMRTDVSVLDYASLAVFDGAALLAVSSATINSGQTGKNSSYVEMTGSGYTQYRPYVGLFNNTSNGYIGFSAEL